MVSHNLTPIYIEFYHSITNHNISIDHFFIEPQQLLHHVRIISIDHKCHTAFITYYKLTSSWRKIHCEFFSQ